MRCFFFLKSGQHCASFMDSAEIQLKEEGSRGKMGIDMTRMVNSATGPWKCCTYVRSFSFAEMIFSYSSILKISLFQQMQAENYSTSLVVTQHIVPSFFMLWMLFKCFWICTTTGKFDLKLCYDKQYKTDVIGLLVYLWLQCEVAVICNICCQVLSVLQIYRR